MSSTPLVLILVVIGAYLAAHVAFDALARRYHIVSGAEYLLLGVLLGPEVSGFIRADAVGGFAPFMTLALGWIGALVGAQFYVPALVRIPGETYRVAVVEAVTSLAVVTAAMTGVLVALPGMEWREALLPATALGAVATVSAPTGIALASRARGRADPVLRQLEVTTAIDAAIAVLALGLLFSIAHEPPAVRPRPPTATEWAVITIGIGLVGGVLFHLFLAGERKIDRLAIALGGAIILSSGAAAYLRLSPLLPAMLVGMILVNTSPSRDEVREVLGRVERPLYFVLLIFAGAAWSADGGAWILPVLAFLAARPAAKLAAAWLGAFSAGRVSALGGAWGRALFGQGGLAVAIGLNYRLHGSPLNDIVFTAAILSVLLTDIGSARLADQAARAMRARRRAAHEAPPPAPPGAPGPR